MKSFLVLLLASTFLSTQSAQPAKAASTDSKLSLDQGSLFTADEIQYDKQTEIVTAKGNVEIVQGERILKADQVRYSIREDKVTAAGNIVLLEPTGEVLFADNIELYNELKIGAIRDIRVLFTDNSRLAAQSAVKVDENRTELNKAVYSTCQLCADDRDAAPLWQVKSSKVVHDKQEKTITYKNAVMEFFGIPVLYTPYFSHPDPTVDRLSGFLAPSVFNSSDLGYGTSLPYYYVISEDKDVTITPTFMTDENLLLAAEYRQAVDQGSYTLDSSITYAEESSSSGDNEIQGHIRGLGDFDITDAWSWGFDFFATTNDTYLDKYDISSQDSLTSTVYLQGLRGRNYSKLSAYAFQGLEAEDDTGTTPFVPAWWEYSYVGEPNKLGARFDANLDALTMVRTDGQDTNRFSASGGWHLPYTSSSGQVFTLETSLRGDAYYTRDQLEDPYDLSSETSNELTARVIPSISLKWNYPFVRHSGTTRQLIEPVAEIVWSEALGSKNTPNEDSLSFEFDDTNLFGSNRYAGLDEVEEGGRVNYGVNFGFYGENGGYSSLLVGQSIHLDNDTSFGEATGLEDQFSDFVARLEIQPTDYFKFTQRVRMDQETLSLARNEVDFFVGTEENWVGLGYLSLRDDLSASGIDKREEVNVGGRVKMTEFWSSYGNYTRDLGDEGGSIDATFGVEYLDECFGFALEARREFTRKGDLDPSTTIGFKIRLLPFN